MTIDDLITDLESRGLGWSLDHASRLLEARIWHWPFVVGRCRPVKTTPLVAMLTEAMLQVDFEYYTILEPGEEIKPYFRSDSLTS